MSTEKLASSASQVMDLHDLIAAPLVATIDADSLSAQRYLDYLLGVAFESYDPANGRTGPLRMLRFAYRSGNGEDERQVEMPLLSLVPLPLLHVKEAVFDFNINILDAVSTATEEQYSFTRGSVLGSRPQGGLRMRASLAAQTGGGAADSSTRHTLSANMKVHISMGQADMPAGLANLLRMAATQ